LQHIIERDFWHARTLADHAYKFTLNKAFKHVSIRFYNSRITCEPFASKRL
jgi:hypothetical protein